MSQYEALRGYLDSVAGKGEVALINPTANTHEDYFRVFRLRTEELVGKKVLDVGGGGSNFTAFLIEAGIDAYAIDPRYVAVPLLVEEVVNLARKQLSDEDTEIVISSLADFTTSFVEHPDRYKVATVTELPFEDESFDLVVASLLMTRHLAGKVMFETGMRELLRVTKRGGRIMDWPVPQTKDGVEIGLKRTGEEAKAWLAKHEVLLKEGNNAKVGEEETVMLSKLDLYRVLSMLQRTGKIEPPRFFGTSGCTPEDFTLRIVKK